MLTRIYVEIISGPYTGKEGWVTRISHSEDGIGVIYWIEANLDGVKTEIAATANACKFEVI